VNAIVMDQEIIRNFFVHTDGYMPGISCRA